MGVFFVAFASLTQASLMTSPSDSLPHDLSGPQVQWSFDRSSINAVTAATVPTLVGVFVPDTVQDQEIFEYSDAYYSRLDLHRKASYTMLPLFMLQYIAGEQLLTKGRFAPGWAKTTHTPLAIGVGGLFLVNTVTGAMNLSESARDPNGRTRRTLHALMMFAADVGFAFSGFLAPSTNSVEQRLAVGDTSWTPHKYVAVSSMGIAVAGWLLMVLWNG